MKLWLISQNENDGYDTYDSAVVAAETEEEAKHTHPNGYVWRGSWGYLGGVDGTTFSAWRSTSDWTDPSTVRVEYLGETDKPAGVICASFNAG